MHFAGVSAPARDNGTENQKLVLAQALAAVRTVWRDKIERVWALLFEGPYEPGCGTQDKRARMLAELAFRAGVKGRPGFVRRVSLAREHRSQNVQPVDFAGPEIEAPNSTQWRTISIFATVCGAGGRRLLQ